MKLQSSVLPLVLTFAAGIMAQTIQLTGTVTNTAGGAALEHAIVSLKNRPAFKDTTGVDGRYSLTGTVAVLAPASRNSISGACHLNGYVLEFSTQGIEPVSVEIFTVSGARKASILIKSLLAPGKYRADLTNGNFVPGLYLVHYHQGGISSVFSYAPVNSRQLQQRSSLSKQVSSNGALKQEVATLDTLIFTRAGFTTARAAISSYSGQHDIALQSNVPIPAGAAALGYTNQVIYVQPTVADIATDTMPSDFYNGMFYSSTTPSMSLYSMTGDLLTLALGGGICTQTRKSKPGNLPLLYAKTGFYVEYAVTLSDNNADHWPAVWMMPEEHDLKQSDRLPTDSAGFERWVEIDVDEGGFYAGPLTSVINWTGIYPNYTNSTYNNYGQGTTLDRTKEHIFGVSYDPVNQVIKFWLDGVAGWSKNTSAFSATNLDPYHYYLIISNQTHGANTPYSMYVRYVSAYIPPS